MSMPDQVDKKPLPEEIGQLLAPYSSELQSTLEQFIGTPNDKRGRGFFLRWSNGDVVLPCQPETLGRGVLTERVLGLHYSVKDREIPVVDLNWALVGIKAAGMSNNVVLEIQRNASRSITVLNLSWRPSDRSGLLGVVGKDSYLGMIIGRLGYGDYMSGTYYEPSAMLNLTYRADAFGLALRQRAVDHYVEKAQTFLGDVVEGRSESVDLGLRYTYIPQEDRFNNRDPHSTAKTTFFKRYGISPDPVLLREEFVGATQGLLALIPSSGNFAHPPR